MTRLASAALATLALGATATAAAAQHPVTWTAAAPATAVPRGSVALVHLTARIDGGWHVYSLTQGSGGPIPAQITLAPDQPFTLADAVHGPTPTKRFDPNFGIKVETYDATATFAVPVRVAPDAPSGATTIAINARFQTCNDSVCLPPHTERLAVPITVAAAHARSTSAGY